MFKIKKVKPLFTGVITTAKTYVGDVTNEAGIIVNMEGQLNPYQWVVAVGSMVQDIKEGDIVKLNFKRYAKAKHTPGAIDEGTNMQADDMRFSYELPIINIDGQTCLYMQNNDVEYIVVDKEIDEGGLLQ
jgi:hypothetical protein